MGKAAVTALQAALGQGIGNNSPLARLLEILARNSSDSPGGLDPLARVWFVDGSSTVTPTDGSIGAPFLTISEAMTASASGDTVLVAPGTYAENVTVPTTRTSLSLVSLGGSRVTSITGTGAAVDTVRYVPSVVATSFTMRGFSVTANPAQDAVSVDGISGTGNFESGVVIDDVVINSANSAAGLNLRACGAVQISDVLNNAMTILNGCSTANVQDTSTDGMTVNFDFASFLPDSGRSTTSLQNTSVTDTLTLSGQPQIVVNTDSSAHIVDGAALSVNGTNGPVIIFNGQQGEQGSAGTFSLTMPNPAGTNAQYDFRGARLFGAVSLGLAAGTQAIDARGVSLYSSVTTTGAGVVDLNIRGSVTNGAFVMAAGHTLDRDEITFASQAFGAGATAVAITPPLPAGATYVVTVGLTAVLAAAADDPFITAQLVTGFTVNSTAGASAALYLRRTQQP